MTRVGNPRWGGRPCAGFVDRAPAADKRRRHRCRADRALWIGRGRASPAVAGYRFRSRGTGKPGGSAIGGAGGRYTLGEDERRTVATRPEFESGPPEAGPDASRSLAPDEQLARREADARLLDALAALSDAEREIILLRHYSGLPFRQIAEMLDIPLGTALSRAHRALSHLRRLLGGSG